MYVAVIGSLGSLLLLYWKRRAYPANLLLLAVFTSMEAFTVGSIGSLIIFCDSIDSANANPSHSVAFTDRTIVVHALLLTLTTFLSLTAYTLQSKRDFSGMGPYLFAGLSLCLSFMFVQFFFPFSTFGDGVLALGTAGLFSAYVVYDTHMIFHRLSPEEYIVASVDLYLDISELRRVQFVLAGSAANLISPSTVNLFLQFIRILQDFRS
jgi:FtsH-binding integral membrane protein